MKKRSLTEPYGNNKKHRVDNNVDNTRYTTRNESSEKTATLEPTNLYSEGLSYFRRGNFGLAAQFFEQAIKLDSTIADYKASAGNCYFELRDNYKAAHFFKQAIALDPTNAKYNYSAGLSYFRLSENNNAAPFFEKAAILDPTNAEYCHSAEESYCQLGNYTKAAQLFEQATKLEPTNSEYNYLAGGCYYQVGNYTKAAPFLEQVACVKGNYLSAALAYHKSGNHIKADELYKKQMNSVLIKVERYDRFLEGSIEHKKNIITKCLIPIYKEIIRNNNDTPQVIIHVKLQMANALVELANLTPIDQDHQNITQALELYWSISELPEWRDCHNNRDSLRKILEKIIKLDPDNSYGFKAKAAYEAGNLYLDHTSNYSKASLSYNLIMHKALNYYKEVIKLNPEFVDAYVQAGIAANELGQVALADEYQSIVKQHFRAMYDQLQDYSTTNYDTEYPVEIDGLIMGYLAGATLEETNMLGSIDTLDSGL